MGKHVGIYKINFTDKKLEKLQEFQTDMSSDEESFTNCLRWSRDNAGLVVAGEDRSIKLFKVASPSDFKTPFEMTCELQNSHLEAINCVDISASKVLLISSGED
jgi:WD40 repeat protein